MYVGVPDEYVSIFDRLYIDAAAPGYAGDTFTLTINGTNYEYTFDSDDYCEVDIASLLISGSNTITLTDSRGVSDNVTVDVDVYVPPLFGMEHPCGFALCQPSDAVSGDQCAWMSRQATTATIGGQTVPFAAGQYKIEPYSSAWTAGGRTYYAHTLKGCEDTVRLKVTGETSRWKIKDNTLNLTDVTNLDRVSELPRMAGIEESITLYKEGLNAYDVAYYSRLLRYETVSLVKDSAPGDPIPCRFSTKKSVIPNGNAGRFTLEIDAIVNVRKPL